MKQHKKDFEDKRTLTNDSKNRKNEKKIFDKKQYRLKTYSNKYKVDQWQERRKRAVLRDYYKELQKDQSGKKKLSESKDDAKTENETSGAKKKPSFFDITRKEYERKKEEKKRKKEEILRVKTEREEALRKYKEKKIKTYKKLSKKTKKGQPVMKDRIELLLEKIQQDIVK
ncbi:hypothetical protein KPH14_007921 [Odynerus spinipes]|uniref:Thyroid transcription factor 1-associated protein 26 n=1 Tax=Odynerus spinipes TaxID=1348599 RepID=A0AAD9RJZ7_9HYME|nr:hypothetical protein KPH14_007921 [Odynerus spinipes]